MLHSCHDWCFDITLNHLHKSFSIKTHHTAETFVVVLSYDGSNLPLIYKNPIRIQYVCIFLNLWHLLILPGIPMCISLHNCSSMNSSSLAFIRLGLDVDPTLNFVCNDLNYSFLLMQIFEFNLLSTILLRVSLSLSQLEVAKGRLVKQSLILLGMKISACVSDARFLVCFQSILSI